MRHLGILGHSAEGAALCFRTSCHEGAGALGPHTHPDVTLDCIAFGPCMPAYERGDHRAVRDVVAVGVARLAAAGADFFACPDNTVHQALEEPGPDLALPGLHIARVVADRAAGEGRRVVGVLGTAFTMDGPVYPQALSRHGIRTEVPETADRDTVDRIIFTELVDGVVTDASRRHLQDVVRRLAARGCDAVALACTELPLLLTARTSPLPVLDSTRLLARAALDVALERHPRPTWRGGPLPA